jgi:hypothetical protein
MRGSMSRAYADRVLGRKNPEAGAWSIPDVKDRSE